MLLIIRSPFVAIHILFLKGLDGLKEAKSWLLINPPDGDVHVGMCTVMVHLSMACSPSLTFITGRQAFYILYIWAMPRGYKTVFILNSVEHEIYSAHEY